MRKKHPMSLPKLNQVLCDRYTDAALDDMRKRSKIIEEREDGIDVQNIYVIKNILVSEYITVDRRSGKPLHVRKEFENVNGRARPVIFNSVKIMSDNSNGVFYRSSSDFDKVIVVEASVSPSGEIDQKVVNYFKEIEAITYWQNILSSMR